MIMKVSQKSIGKTNLLAVSDSEPVRLKIVLNELTLEQVTNFIYGAVYLITLTMKFKIKFEDFI